MPRIAGPVFFYDLLRMTRRTRFFIMRTAFVCILWLILFLSYAVLDTKTTPRPGPGFQQVTLTNSLFGAKTPEQLANFAERFVGSFFLTQFIIILFITPSVVAGAISDEKEKQTLEYIFTTDIRNHELVFGKYLSRLANMGLLLLAGLPILSLVQFFGGVPWQLITAGFSVCFVTMLSLASLTIYHSVYAKNVRITLIKTYVWFVAYFAIWGVLFLLKGMMALDVKSDGTPMLVMDNILWGYNSGNPIMAAFQANVLMSSKVSNIYALQPLFFRYITFHGIIAVFFLLLSWLLVRRVFVKQRFEQARKGKKLFKETSVFVQPVLGTKKRRRVIPLPEQIDRPMTWKERHFSGSFEQSTPGKTIYIMLMGLFFSPGVVFFGLFFNSLLFNSSFHAFYPPVRNYLMVVLPILMVLTLLTIIIRASASFTSEKDRQMWETLMSSTLTLQEIYQAKWWAAVRSARVILTIMGLLIFLGCITGQLPIYTMPIVVLQLVAFVYFTTSLALFFAALGKSTVRALISSSLWVFLLTIFPAPIMSALQGSMFFGLSSFYYQYSREFPYSVWLINFLAFSFSPVYTFLMDFFFTIPRFFDSGFFVMAVIGPLIFLLLGRLFYNQGFSRLRKDSGRTDESKAAEEFGELPAAAVVAMPPGLAVPNS